MSNPTVFFCCSVAVIFISGVSVVAEARDKEESYVPEIIEVEQPNAWCYVLQNQNNLVGGIHMLSCVPKWNTDRNPDVLSLEESDSD